MLSSTGIVERASDAHLYRLQHHITGVKVHNTNQTYLFTWTDAFRPDANITLNALSMFSVTCASYHTRQVWFP
ncbi:hypothetical protein DPMN_172303, partial [Dreissena polymorpha]